MQITLSQNSDKAFYQQLYDQISSQIIRGKLSSNERLPPIRTVAKEIRVSIITVKKAWEQLEQEGLIYTVVGRGSFVQEHSQDDLQRKLKQKVREKLVKDVGYYKEMGLPLEYILQEVKMVYQES